MLVAAFFLTLLSAEPSKALPGPTSLQTSTPRGAVSPAVIFPVSDAIAQAAAGVYRLDLIPDQGAKLFGLLGTDPVFNGLNTYIAFYGSPSEAWVVYPIGDFIDYKVLSISAGQVVLEIQENPDPADPSQVSSRRIAIDWGPIGGAVPTSVTVTPAGT